MAEAINTKIASFRIQGMFQQCFSNSYSSFKYCNRNMKITTCPICDTFFLLFKPLFREYAATMCLERPQFAVRRGISENKFHNISFDKFPNSLYKQN